MTDDDKDKRELGAAGTDEHASPQNPDNQIELERVAADAGHEAAILAQSGNEAADKSAQTPKRGGPRTGKTRAGKMVNEVASTGHSWDGITEYDNPMPRWWVWTFYATIVWGVIYTIFYPAWPLINGATQGLLHTNYRKELAAEMQRYDEANAPIQAKLVAADLDAIAARTNGLLGRPSMTSMDRFT